MKFNLLQEGKIIFHPGKMSDDGQFLDPDGNPYDPIVCDPTVLARKSKGPDDSEGPDKPDDISSYVPGSDDDNEDEPWIDVDTFDPYDEDEDEDEYYGFDPEEIDKEKTTDYEPEKEDEGDEGKEGKEDGPSKDPKDPPKEPKKPEGPPKEPPKKPEEPPRDPLPPDKPMPTISGKLIDPHTFVTDDGRTIKL